MTTDTPNPKVALSGAGGRLGFCEPRQSTHCRGVLVPLHDSPERYLAPIREFRLRSKREGQGR